MSSKTLRDELRYLIFSEIYQKLATPKAKRKAFSIIEASIQVLGRRGFEGFTLEGVAREAATTRQLLKHYFEDVDDLVTTTVKYVRLFFQKLAVDAILSQQQPDEALKAYIGACFYWVENFRAHALVWFSFLNRCLKNKDDRKLNTAAVLVGEARIATLLELGKTQGLFSHLNSVDTAKKLQVVITGALLTITSEDLSDTKHFKAMMTDQCLSLTES